ncbi:MAG: hypothetical protein AAF502_25475 [Bacteroidota bacterium]
MDDKKLKSLFGELVNGEIKNAPNFEDMWQKAEKNDIKKPLFKPFRLVAAASILIAGSLCVMLWLNRKPATVQTTVQMLEWQSPTAGLLKIESNVQPSGSILEWQSPTSVLMIPSSIKKSN